MKSGLFGKALTLLNLVSDVDYGVLDIGCGTGDFLGQLARSIGANSHLTGCDAMARAVAKARTTYPNHEFICHRFVTELPFPDACFDVVLTMDTMECIHDKRALVEEIHRVLKPGGQVLAMHWDWDTQLYNITDRELARRVIRAFSDWKQPWMDEADGQMGRKLWGWFEGSGRFLGSADAFCLIETAYESGRYGYERARDMAGLVGAGGLHHRDYERFMRALSDSSVMKEYFYSLTSFIYHGRRV